MKGVRKDEEERADDVAPACVTNPEPVCGTER